MSEAIAWWRSLPWPGVSRSRTLGWVREEVSFSERYLSSDERVVEGSWQVAVWGAWEVWVGEGVPLASYYIESVWF